MDIFSKLNTLKSIEPSESWVVDTKEKVLSEAPIFGRKSVLENNIDKKSNLGFNLQDLFQNLTFKKLAVPAFSLVFVLSTGIFTIGASKSSLPGEFLYSIKMINEDMALVIASEDKKAEIEVEHAGKRVEEIVEISKKTSDIEQQEKLAQLMEKFDEKMSSANDRLANTSGNGEKTKVARVINIQSKKYTEVLAKTTDDLPAVIKDEILEEVAKAIDSSEKMYLTSLAVITEEGVDNDAGEEDQNNSVEDGDGIEEGGEIKGIEEDVKKEPLDDLNDGSDDSNNPDDGDVLGVEDNVEDNSESDSLDIIVNDVDGEEIILEETEEEVIKVEVDEEIE